VRCLGWLGAVLCLAAPRAALAQRSGDPTPGSLAPLVAIVTPATGAATGLRLRVEARVHHPGGLAAIASVQLTVTGATTLGQPMAPSAAYAPAPDAAIYEATIDLAPGASTLLATATDGAGRSTGSAPVALFANDGLGDGNLLVREGSSQLCGACHDLAAHGSEALGRAYGAWTTTCRDCHQPHGTRNLDLVRESILPPWLAGGSAPAPRPVRFAGRSGHAPSGGVASPALGSYANGDGSGPCQACHTRTARWRDDGSADAGHRGDCGFCHGHRRGFRARCQDCHGAPPATGAHAAHAVPTAPQPPFPSDPRPFGCGSCHPADPSRHGDGGLQVELNAGLTLVGGTRTGGAALWLGAGGPSCLVACHFPLGATPATAPVAWSGGGPLPCTSCHARVNPGGQEPSPRAGPSLHDPVFSEARPASGEPTTCWSCHDDGRHDAAHTTGDPATRPDAALDATCLACHRPPSGPAAGPEGQVLHRGADAASSRTPPVLQGWSTAAVDATSGDFHGGRRGTCFGPGNGPQPCAPAATPTGFGGALLPPYVRGQPALPCRACHAGHASQNAFLIAPMVNGTALPPGAIDRAGVGAERLCEACHAGGRHERCMTCHTDTIICPGGQCYMDPDATHVDPAPAGSACFWCHGHEGILRWTEPYSGADMSRPGDPSCVHCHGFSMPPTRTAPPALAVAPAVSGVSAGAASVTWRTDWPTTSWVEYGVDQPGWVTGGATEVGDHTVVLSGLAPGTTYRWRVRSVDAFRNVVRSAVATFTTTAAGAVPIPDLVPVGSTGSVAPVNTVVASLRWYPVASPTGAAVEYRVELASDPGFTSLVNGAPRDSGWIAGTPGTWLGRPALSFPVTLTNLPYDDCTDPPPFVFYWWRVKARDAVSGIESDWSVVDRFGAIAADPWGC